MKTQEGGKYFW